MTDPHPHCAMLRAVYADVTRLLDHAAENVVLHPATRAVDPRVPDVVGKGAVRAWQRDLLRATGGTLVLDAQQISANDYFGTVLGTLTARFGDREMGQPFCGLWRFQDGRITEHWENVYDPARLAALAPARPHPAQPGEPGARAAP